MARSESMFAATRLWGGLEPERTRYDLIHSSYTTLCSLWSATTSLSNQNARRLQRPTS